MKWFERLFKWGLFSFGVLLFGFLFISNIEPYPMPVNQSYTHYEVKKATNSAFAVRTNQVLNAWDWTRRVNRIDVVRRSSHTIFCDFTKKVSSFTFTVPTVYSSYTYVLDGSTTTNVLSNIYTFYIESDAFSIYIATMTTAPDITVIGYGY